jgi:hypothetical protein
MTDFNYGSHRTGALDHADRAVAAAQPDGEPRPLTPETHLKLAHVEAMIYVGDQICRAIDLVEREIERERVEDMTAEAARRR